jgi:hypothetical protein
MSTVNYKDIFDAIVTSIETYPSFSLHHVDQLDWIDDEGKLQQSAVNNGFSVFVSGKEEDGEYSGLNANMLNFNIEFALDATHNNYLSKLGYCEEVIVGLEDVSQSNIKIHHVLPVFSCEIENKLVRVKFNEIYFITPNR